MKKRFKKLAALLGMAVIVTSLAACGGGNGDSASSGQSGSDSAPGGNEEIKSVNVTIPTVYDLPDKDMVEEAINKITEEKYQIHLDLEFITTGNWLQQSNLLFTGDEADIIAAFMTPLSTYVKNGQMTDLTDYYANASDEFKAV